jgi:hypothetical protein
MSFFKSINEEEEIFTSKTFDSINEEYLKKKKKINTELNVRKIKFSEIMNNEDLFEEFEIFCKGNPILYKK